LASELITQRNHWSKYLATIRAALAVALFAFQLFWVQNQSVIMMTGFGVYAFTALYTVARKPTQSGAFGLMALFIDTLLFLTIAVSGGWGLSYLPPLFFMYVVAEALALHGPREVVLVCAVCIVFLLIPRSNAIGTLGPAMAVAVFAGTFSFHKKNLEHRLSDLEDDAVRWRETADSAAETERERIAHNFHDGPLQSMISFQMRLEILRKLFERDAEAGLRELQQLQDLAKNMIRELRSYVRNMRPIDIEGATLSASTRRLVEEFEKESGIAVTFVGGEIPFAIPPEICTDVLQMIREGLHNIQKHSQATRVALGIEKAGTMLEVSIDDNGTGFHFSGAYTLDELELLRLGPVSIKRRVRSLGADLVLDSRPGRGAGIKIKIPV
jgi:signal transduction histidine kinase